MMIRILLLLILFPFFSFSQKIKSNTVDGFTNEHSIETTIVTLKQSYTNGFGASYTALNNNYYLDILGYGPENKTIDDDDKLWFVLENGTVVKFDLRVKMPSNDSEFPNIYLQHYYVKPEDLEEMKNNRLAIVRIVHSDGISDVNISKGNAKSFAKLNGIFLDEISK